MNKSKLFFLILFLIIGCTKDPINYENLLYEKDGVFYGKESNKPYSGKVFSLYGDGKKRRLEI